MRKLLYTPLILTVAWLFHVSRLHGADLPPIISVQPQPQTVNAGGTITLGVVATGAPPLAYQWLKSGSAVAGATNATLVQTNASLSHSGNYKVNVSNGGGTTASAEVAVTVTGSAAPPQIVVQPLPQKAVVGGSATFAVGTAGSGGVTYQWRKDGNNLSGKTDATLVLTNISASDAGSYSVTITGSGGTTNSASATLTVGELPKILVPPLDQTVAAGADATFVVQAQGSAPLTYQWSKDGVVLEGKTDAALKVTAVGSAQVGNYTVVVANDFGTVTSGNAKLAVSALPPSIVLQPIPATATVGGTAGFAVGAVGSGNLQYQWKKDGSNLGGQTSANLVLTNVSLSSAGKYSVTVSNDAGSTTSAEVSLVVVPPPVPVNTLTNIILSALSAPLSVGVEANGDVVVSGQVQGTPGKSILLRIKPSGQVDATLGTAIDGQVNDVTVGADGKLLVSGSFTTVNGQSRPNLVRLNPDGSIDSSFNATGSANGGITAIDAQTDGKTVAVAAGNGGTSTALRLNADGSVDTSFGGGTLLNGSVADAEVTSDGRVVVGGNFTAVNGSNITAVARLNSNGSLDLSFNGQNLTVSTGAVRAVEIDGSGKALIGGDFQTGGGVGRGNLARLNGDGSVDTTFGQGLTINGPVNDIAVQADGKVLIGGSFTTVASSPRTGLARLTANGQLDPSFDASVNVGEVQGVDVRSDGTIVVTGTGGVAFVPPNVGGTLAPLLFGSARASGQFKVSLETQNGRTYVLEASPVVNGSAWTQVGTVNGNGSVQTVVDGNASANARFYRVRTQ